MSVTTADLVYAHHLIDAERRRQIEEEGYSLEHDRGHGETPLLRAARSYATHPGDEPWVRTSWPWDPEAFKPRDHLSNLIRAGALYQAAADLGGSVAGAAKEGRDRAARQIAAILHRAHALEELRRTRA